MLGASAADGFIRFGKHMAPRVRMIGFPFAGGGAAAFQTWQPALPAHLELCALRLPGREGRIAEPSFRRIVDMAEHAADVVTPLLDRPCVFFGHSMGAVLAFEVARTLRRRGGPVPAHLFLACAPAPHVRLASRPIHVLPDREFLAELRDMNGTPEAVFENPELLALVIGTLRADFEACETYAFAEEPPLVVPISAFAALGDRGVANADVAAWGRHTTARFTMRSLPGGHFLPFDDGGFLRTAIWHDLARMLATPFMASIVSGA